MKSYVSGVLDETRHTYFTDSVKWQVIEERVDSSSDPHSQHVWGLRYIDDLILRDQDTTANGMLDERLYAMQDANWNVTALADTSGSAQERFAYLAYGKPIFLTGSFAAQNTSANAWNILFGSYQLDIATQLYSVRHRTYQPYLGTWIQRDPIRFNAEDGNLYRYVRNYPTLQIDPAGLQEAPLLENPFADPPRPWPPFPGVIPPVITEPWPGYGGRRPPVGYRFARSISTYPVARRRAFATCPCSTCS